MSNASRGIPYYHRTQQYSITALTNGGGTITERYAYSAYGTPTITDASGTARTTTAENNRYLYTGREYDEALGLYHYRARMYDSSAGRFCSRDPVGFGGSAWNLYRYVSGSPLVRIDPTGLIDGNGGGERPGDIYDPYEPSLPGEDVFNTCKLLIEIVWEPAGWPDTARDVAENPCSPTTYIGLLPLVPNVKLLKKCFRKVGDTDIPSTPDGPRKPNKNDGGNGGGGDFGDGDDIDQFDIRCATRFSVAVHFVTAQR